MNRIIQPLTNEVLTQFGFIFDGYYWINNNIPFKLIATDKENTYLVDIPNLPQGVPAPPPIENNSNLLTFMVQMSGNFFKSKIGDWIMTADPAIITFELDKLIKEYFNFNDDRLSIKAVVSRVGVTLNPANEYTYTILAGFEAQFKITFNDGESELLWYNPNVISYEFLKSLFPEKEIKFVEILINEEYKPFFGVGIKLQ